MSKILIGLLAAGVGALTGVAWGRQHKTEAASSLTVENAVVVLDGLSYRAEVGSVARVGPTGARRVDFKTEDETKTAAGPGILRLNGRWNGEELAVHFRLLDDYPRRRAGE